MKILNWLANHTSRNAFAVLMMIASWIGFGALILAGKFLAEMAFL